MYINFECCQQLKNSITFTELIKSHRFSSPAIFFTLKNPANYGTIQSFIFYFRYSKVQMMNKIQHMHTRYSTCILFPFSEETHFFLKDQVNSSYYNFQTPFSPLSSFHSSHMHQIKAALIRMHQIVFGITRM